MNEKIKGVKRGEHEIIGLDEPGIFDYEQQKENCHFKIPIIRAGGGVDDGCFLRANCRLRIRARGAGKSPYCCEEACPLVLRSKDDNNHGEDVRVYGLRSLARSGGKYILPK